MDSLINLILQHISSKKKITPSGWVSFNAPCCHNNGHTQDTRGRGGLKINNATGISYHCFNCGYRCSWQKNRTLSYKMKKFLEWLGIPDSDIRKIALELLQQKTSDTISLQSKIVLPEINKIEIPKHFICINNIENPPKNIIDILHYIKKRNLFLEDSLLYYSEDIAFKNRLIIPFFYKKNFVGFTARAIYDKTSPRYLTNSQPGYIFGLDKQTQHAQFIIIVEGPIDAMLINGVSILGSEFSNEQINLIKSLNTEVIVVPDKDKAGKKLYEQSLDLNFSLSFPNWQSNIKDVSEAVNTYGRLYTLYDIVKSVKRSKLKIQLGAKKWFG